jgi:23S rRNA pseudouridine1911/1915/1917 synthase
MSIKTVIVQPSDSGERLDTFLAKETGITRSQIQKFLGKGDILVNETSASQNYRTKENDVIRINIVEAKNDLLVPESLPVNVLYEDEHLIVVNKPAGMIVYPAAGHSHGTLMNALASHCSRLASVGGPLRPGVVHRLDKDTSGVMVVALHDRAYYSLAEQFKQRMINRRYIALVHGDLEDNGEIALKIGRSETDRKKMSTQARKGKEAVTRWRVIKRFGKATLIEVKLGTGRTHQIRVHFSSIGHPVLGDRTYGKKIEIEIRSGKRIAFPRQMLHAQLLGVNHPATNEYLEFSSPLPEDIARKIQELELHLISPGNAVTR